MSNQEGLYQWKEEVARKMPHLSKSQATVLALWSFGIVLAKSCALTAVSVMMAALIGKKENTLRQQLREFCYDAEDKKGKKRKEIEVEENFVPLLKWVLSIWKSDKLALAVDATTLADIFVVLVVSVVYKGSAIPVAWKILPATQKHPWRGEWLRMLRIIRKAIPKSMFVNQL
ncbi:MAG: transposase IS4 family protein [bacterium]|nr:MAG: transposase IS4 family protein [bacterium]